MFLGGVKILSNTRYVAGRGKFFFLQISGMFLGGVKILSNTRYVAGRGSCLGQEGEIPEDNFLARHMLPTNLTTHFVDSNTLCVLLKHSSITLKEGKNSHF